jgi:hypothetical protein
MESLLFCFAVEFIFVLLQHPIRLLVCGDEAHVVHLRPSSLRAAEDGSGSAEGVS